MGVYLPVYVVVQEVQTGLNSAGDWQRVRKVYPRTWTDFNPDRGWSNANLGHYKSLPRTGPGSSII